MLVEIFVFHWTFFKQAYVLKWLIMQTFIFWLIKKKKDVAFMTALILTPVDHCMGRVCLWIPVGSAVHVGVGGAWGSTMCTEIEMGFML